jgi:hypothetical protein
MNTVQECVCCREIGTIVGKINQLEDSSILCITAHPGFNFVCLNVWVLQTAYTISISKSMGPLQYHCTSKLLYCGMIFVSNTFISI